MDAIDYVNYIGALLFVLGLILGLAWLVKRTGLGSFAGLRHKVGSERRLAVKEALAIDTRHRLVLIQRDDQEHLILIGPQTQTVIETAIKPSIKSSAQAAIKGDRE